MAKEPLPLPFMIEVKMEGSEYIASFILGSLDTPKRDCKRVLWSSPMPNAETALDNLYHKVARLFGLPEDL
jgi:hypothetical protein